MTNIISPSSCRPVDLYDIRDKFLGSFRSQKELANFLGLRAGGKVISQALRNRNGMLTTPKGLNLRVSYSHRHTSTKISYILIQVFNSLSFKDILGQSNDELYESIWADYNELMNEYIDNDYEFDTSENLFETTSVLNNDIRNLIHTTISELKNN